MTRSRPPEQCANCGAEIPAGAKACPDCGADEQTGWRESSIYDGLELPDEAFDDDVIPEQPTPRVNGIAWYWWCVAVALLVLIILAFVR